MIMPDELIAIMLQKHPAPWRMNYFSTGYGKGVVITDAKGNDVVMRKPRGGKDQKELCNDTMRGLVALVGKHVA